MPAEIIITIDDASLQAATNDPDLVAGPVADFLAKMAFTIESSAKELAPVDTGRLRSSIVSLLSPAQAVVRASAEYAAYVEFGTRPHFPPIAPLALWGKRHGGIPGWALARAIGRRGTRPQPFMEPAARTGVAQLDALLQEMSEAIQQKWENDAKGGV